MRTLCHRYLIVRSAWVYGIGRDFVSTVLNAAADPTCPWLAVPTDRFASPTSADDLTAAVEQLIDHDTLGIYTTADPMQHPLYRFFREHTSWESGDTVKYVETNCNSVLNWSVTAFSEVDDVYGQAAEHPCRCLQ